jgi:rSAM/selenodomain-associated transferase 1
MSSDPPRASATRIRLLVMAKSPVAGRVKTRLCPPFSFAQAAELAAAAIADTLAAAVAAVPLAARHGCTLEPVLVLDGEHQGWLPRLLHETIGEPVQLRVLPQRGDGLDRRLAAAFEDAAQDLPAVLIGMDTPQVTAGILVDAITELARPDCDAVLGHADDGGFWLLGLQRADPALLRDVPMSTSTTGMAQQARLRASGLRVSLLPPLRDVDTVEDAEHVAAQAPDSRFARSFEQLRPSVAASL